MAESPLEALLSQLLSQAQPRPDLVTPGSTGKLENAKPVTYLGRVVQNPEMLDSLLKRMPQGELESGGTAMSAIPGMAMAGGLPLGRLMQLPPGRDLNKILEQMWQQFKSNHPKANRDAWIKTKLDDIAMSTYGRGTDLSGNGMNLRINPNYERPDLGSLVLGNESDVQGIPRMHQAAATINMADRSGMLNADTLSRATAAQSREFGGAAPKQSLLDQLSDYLEQIRPKR